MIGIPLAILCLRIALVFEFYLYLVTLVSVALFRRYVHFRFTVEKYALFALRDGCLNETLTFPVLRKRVVSSTLYPF